MKDPNDRLSVQMAVEHVEGKHADKPGAYCYRCQCHGWEWEAIYWRWTALNRRRVWFHTPGETYNRVSPLWVGNDEYHRRTLVIGWGFTGQAVVALWRCRCKECRQELADLDAWLDSNDPDKAAA